MKYVKYILVLAFMGLLASCYEVNEEIEIDEKGNGTYVMKMDMGQLLEMMQSVAGEEELSKEGLDKAIDTTIRMKDILDSAKKITPEQKALLANGTMKLQMNVQEKLFKLNLHFPYQGYDNLQKLMSGQGSSGGGISGMFKQVFGNDKKEEDTTLIVDKATEPDLSDVANIYDVTIRNGFISKKVNAEKLKSLKERPELAQLDQLLNSGLEVPYTTTIKLPRPVKKSDNPIVKLSDDKKTVTIQYNLLELLNTPDKFSYSLEF